MLQIESEREYYLGKVGEFPLMQDIVSGETTLGSSLDELLDRMEQESKFFKKNDLILEEFKSYLDLMTELNNGMGLNRFEENAAAIANYKRTLLVLGGSGLAAIGGLVLLAFPPFNALEYVLYYGGVFGSFKSIRTASRAKKDRKKAFGQLYSIADANDDRIGQLFVMEHFTTAPKRFEQTYLALDQEERAQVDTQLYAMLGVGGIKGMDEHQLDDYLSRLQRQEAKQER